MTQTIPGTPTWLRTRNDRTAFRLILEHGPLSRSRLSELSGMSKPTAGQMISRLEGAGLLEPAGENSGARGPNAVLYGVRRTVMTGVAVNILGSEIEATATDPVGAGHPIVTIPVSSAGRSPEADIRRAIEAACAAAHLTADSVSVVAIGVQAAYDAGADQLSFTDTLPGWPLTGVRARLAAATGLTVILDNDVNLAAIAERASGAVGRPTASPTCGSARAWASASTPAARSSAAIPAAPARSATWRCPGRPSRSTRRRWTSPTCSAATPSCTCWAATPAAR